MSGRVLARLGAAVAAVLALLAIALFVLVESSDVRPTSFLSHATDLLLAFSFAAVGSLVALRRPGNLVGSGLLLAALANADRLRFISVPVMVAVLLSAAVAAVGVIRRFRRSRGLDRAQFKWVASSTAVLLLSFPLPLLTDFSGAGGWMVGAALTLLPISIGIAVLRYRLFEIDRIISRTLSYLVLTAILGAAYAGLVIAGQALFSSFAGGSNLSIALSTLVAAALFLPLRSRIQAVVDRRFNRRRYDARRTLTAFGAHVREEIQVDAIYRDLVRAAHETVQPSQAALWLRGGRS